MHSWAWPSCATSTRNEHPKELKDWSANVTGFAVTPAELDRVGLNIMGVERLINYRLGVRRKDDTLPDRWFDEPNTYGAYKGEHVDRAEFDALLSRFYRVSSLTEEGIPIESWRRELEATLGG